MDQDTLPLQRTVTAGVEEAVRASELLNGFSPGSTQNHILKEYPKARL